MRITALFSLHLVSSATEMYTCQHKGHNHFHLTGTALGGWLVLEPWITPSLFYQFLGKAEKAKVGMDSASFCKALGKEEANIQLRRHWKAWVTDDIIANLAESGAESIRIPVGDWMYDPYEPYIGCWDGALEEVDRAIELCKKHGMTVLIDVHAMKDSQNGLDNSGITDKLHWSSNSTFKHWDLREGDWVGHFNLTSHSYSDTNKENLMHGLQVVQNIVDMYKHNPTVIGIEPVNEPWEPTPIEILKKFYWYSYQIVQHGAPHWITLFHDSFRLTKETWGDFLQDCPNYAFDTHIYQAWADPADASWFQEHSCNDGDHLRQVEAAGIPVVVGEWSLATDNCAMWLNGFNDNINGYPKVKCDMVPCAEPYMGPNQPGAPPDASKGKQGPFGTGNSTPEYGMCPIDKSFPNDSEVMRKIALAKMNSFDRSTHGQFYWNFRTELEERWDFQKVVAKGWLPSREEKINRPGRVQRDISQACVPNQQSMSAAQGVSGGMIVVTAVSISLLIGLVCAIGVFSLKASGRDVSAVDNWWYSIRARVGGYSSIGRSSYNDVEMNTIVR